MILVEKLNGLLNCGYTLQKIADVAEKSPASISRFINGNYIIDLHAALKIVKAYFREEEKEIMVDFCMKLDRKNHRIAIEYAIINGYKELFQHLLEKLKQSKNRLDKEWARAYEYEQFLNEGRMKPLELLNKINKTKADSIEINFYLLILASYCYIHIRQFEMMRSLLFEAEVSINQISDAFIQCSYRARYGQALAVVSLYLNEIDDCRKYGKQAVENDLFYLMSGPAYHALGHSYLYESYDRAIDYLNKARNIFLTKGSKASIRKVEHSINFTQIFHQVEPEFLYEDDAINSTYSSAFYYIMKNKHHKATLILDQISLAEVSDYDKGFHFYYLGLINKQADYFYDSIYHFKKSGDMFFRQLPCIKLQQQGVSLPALKALSI